MFGYTVSTGTTPAEATGYSFKELQDRRQFDTVTWYVPMGIDIRQKLTDIEVQNIDLIYRYEEYYHENYDSYGR